MTPITTLNDLTELAKRSMLERHLLVEFPLQVLKELQEIKGPAPGNFPQIKEMRELLWFSLDNDDSRDLDQLTYAKEINDNEFRIYIAIADVDSLVKKGSAIDRFAGENTTSVYTPSKIFTMLPEKLSTDLTSLNENEERVAIVVEIGIQLDGSINDYEIYKGFVRNQAKLAYPSVSNWLDGTSPPPLSIQSLPGLDHQVKLQDKIAKLLRQKRQDKGALTLQTIEPRTFIENDRILDIQANIQNRGQKLIEDFMIAANQCIANFLFSHQVPSLRRVVRIPKRWDRIVEIARKYDEALPLTPDVKALSLFLNKRAQIDPLHFPDLSLTIIKLLGNGEYVVQYPGEKSIGHFGLAVKDYTHSTAPNRRYPDIITQRLVKSLIENTLRPYSSSELEKLALHCTQKEDDAEKVERKMKKSAACLLFQSKINQEFDAIVTGASSQGTWVRTLHPPVDGKLTQGYKNTDVGDFIRVKLVHVDVEKGFIDFVRIQDISSIANKA